MVERWRWFPAVLVLGACILLGRCVAMIAQGFLGILVPWVGALLVLELVVDLVWLAAAVGWWAGRRQRPRALALRAAAAGIVLHFVRVAIFVLGRTGPWTDFDVRPEHRTGDPVAWIWVWTAGVLATLGVIGVGLVARRRRRADGEPAFPGGVRKIVSGGQTGADRAALDVAEALGLATGGWVPKGRLAEDGRIPDRYVTLVETDSTAYADRTERNVRDADATVVLSNGPPAGGSGLTVALAKEHGKPVLVLDLERAGPEEAADALREWLRAHRPEALNVAGPRASEEPRIGALVRAVLDAALRPPRLGGPSG